MGLSAALCIFIGSQPQYLYNLLPWAVTYWPYDISHVLSQMQLLFFSALAFVWLNRQGLYPPELHAINLDVEWLYRKLLPDTAGWVYNNLHRVHIDTSNSLKTSLSEITKTVASSYLGRLHLATSWPTGSMVFWIAVILGFFLLADIIQH